MRALFAFLLLALTGAPASAAPCRPIPDPVRDIEANRYYVDAAGTIVDPVLRARKDASVKPLKNFLRVASAAADRYIASGERESARCALEALGAWAQGDAMLGAMSSRQADYERNWMLAGVAMAYLKVKPQATPSESKLIEAWLDRVAVEVRRFFDNPARARNNHYYWAALSVGASATATGSSSHWEFARQAVRDAASAVRPDGTLPLEMARERRALWYHAFALAPLVVLSELAARQGEDWYAIDDAALRRLATRVLDGISNPESFEQRTGYRQEGFERGGLTGDILAWIEFYGRRFPQEQQTTRWMGARRNYPELGGDLAQLALHWHVGETH